MLRTLATAFLTLALVVPAVASEEEVYANIEAIHGNADGFFEVFSLLQDAVMFGDPVTFGQYAIYPLAVNDSDGNYEIVDEEDFMNNFDVVLPPATLEAIGSQDVDDLIVTSEGVGLGNGAMWITNICLDDACNQTQWGIFSINN